MKVVALLLLICCLQQTKCGFLDGLVDGVTKTITFAKAFGQAPPACITLDQLQCIITQACNATFYGNDVLWKRIEVLHNAIPDWFMVESPEANCCPNKDVPNPSNSNATILQILRNICCTVNGTTPQKLEALTCILVGRKTSCPMVMSHNEETAFVDKNFSNGTSVARCKMGNATKVIAREEFFNCDCADY